MKPLFSLPFTFTLLVSTSVLAVASATLPEHDNRILPITARPLEDVSLKPNTVWDLSDNWKEEGYCASYILYGDTLLSETVDGNRRWYNIGSDTVTLVREESLLHRCLPDAPIPTNAIHAGLSPVSSEPRQVV